MNSQKHNDAAVDVFDHGEVYSFEFALPGLTREEIHINLNGHALYLTGVRTALSDGGNGLRAERPNGAFVRRLDLPPDSCVNEMQATFQDGVLQLRIPKKSPQDNDAASCA